MTRDVPFLLMMSRPIRKAELTAHIIVSVGWLGAVGAFLALSIAGMTSGDAAIVRSAYSAMNLVCLTTIVPLSLAALATGVIQSLGTHWGLFRHYWVLVKFTLTVVCVALLLMHQFTAVAQAARFAALPGALPASDLRAVGVVLTRASVLGALTLAAVAVLSVYKPWGRVGAGRTEPNGADANERSEAATRRLVTWIVMAVVLGVAAVVVMHLTGHMPALGHMADRHH